jgi:chromosome segregation ATPase
MAQSTGDQLTALNESLQKKKDFLDEKIATDEDTKKGILKEMKALNAKLEEIENRMGKMKTARKEYHKTIQETEFALQKIEETSQQMAERFAKLSKVQVQM